MRTNLIAVAFGTLLLSSCLCLGIQGAKSRNLQAQVRPTENIPKENYAFLGQIDTSTSGEPNWEDVGTYVIGSKADRRIISVWLNADDDRYIFGSLCYTAGATDCKL